MSMRLDWMGFWRELPSHDKVLKRSSIMSLRALSSPVRRASTALGAPVPACGLRLAACCGRLWSGVGSTLRG